MKKTKNLNFTKKMLSYSLTSALVVAGGQEINSEVIYYDIDDVIVGQDGSYEVDIDNDNNSDFKILQNFWSSSSYSSSQNVRFQGLQSNNQVLMDSSSSYAKLMNSNDVVGVSSYSSSSTSQNFFRNAGLGSFYLMSGSSGSTYGTWSGQEGYLGVVFEISGEQHYGWIRLAVDEHYTGFTVKEYAYETIPNLEIQINSEQAPIISEKNIALELTKNRAHVLIPHNPILNLADGAFTIEAWIKNDNTPSSNWKRIITKRGSADTWYSLTLTENKLTLELSSQPVRASLTVTAGPDIQGDGIWHHVAAVRDESGFIYLYVDGVEFDTDENFSENLDNDEMVEIGKWQSENYENETFIGGIDEVRIWNSARTVEEINDTMYNSLLGSEENLLGYWNFETNTDSRDIIDLTVNGNNGILELGKFFGSGIPLKYEISNNNILQFNLNSVDQNLSETFTWSILESPTLGSVTLESPDKSTDIILVNYEPNEGSLGTDTFVIKVTTGNGLSDEIKIVVDVLEASSISSNNLPTKTKLYQNYPNPFNPETKIKYDIFKESLVEISVYNQRGQLTRNLVNGRFRPGSYSTIWNSKDNNGSIVTSGLYIYKMKTGNKIQVLKAVLVK